MESKEIIRNDHPSLDILDGIHDIEPSIGWNDRLMSKLGARRRKKQPRLSRTLFIIFMVLVIGGNIIYGLKVLSCDNGNAEEGSRLEAISNAFLINPVAAKN